MKRDYVIDAMVFLSLAVVAIGVRLACPTPNFHPVTAASLFAGFYFSRRAVALALPPVIMFVSDYFLGGYTFGVMLAVYASLLLPIAWRSVLHRGLTVQRIAAGSVLSSVAFFVVTNAAVWYAWYPPTLSALVRAYTVAVPFFLNALAGDLLFAGAFFGAYGLARAWQSRPSICVVNA